LLRMDTATRYDARNKAVAGGWMSPNEARALENMAPVKGGESPYLQQQNYSLAALAKRDAKPDPFAGPKPPELPKPAEGTPAPPGGTPMPGEQPPAANDAQAAKRLTDALIEKFTQAPATLEPSHV